MKIAELPLKSSYTIDLDIREDNRWFFARFYCKEESEKKGFCTNWVRLISKTKAIMPVHYCGHPSDMDRLLELADHYNMRIIEDACHAFRSNYKGRKF